MVTFKNGKYLIKIDKKTDYINNAINNKKRVNNVINICYCSDRNYFFLCLMSINSLVSTKLKSTLINVFILVNGFSSNEIEDIKNFLTRHFSDENIKFFVLDRESPELKVTTPNSTFPDSVFIRLQIPYVKEFKPFDRVLYIDCDTIINKDLTDFYFSNIENYVFAAGQDIGIVINQEYIKNNQNIDKSQISWMIPHKYIVDFGKKYINSGVLLFNLKYIRSIDFRKICIETYEKMINPFFPDQDLLNFAFKEKIKILEPTINNQIINFGTNPDLYSINALNNALKTKYSSIQEFKQNSYILHYAADKNWIYSQADFVFFKKFIFNAIIKTLYSIDLIDAISIVDFSKMTFNQIIQTIFNYILEKINKE